MVLYTSENDSLLRFHEIKPFHKGFSKLTLEKRNTEIWFQHNSSII